MTSGISRATAVLHSIIVTALVASSPASPAEQFDFRVAFEDVPGAEQLTAGDVGRGIESLEEELKRGSTDGRVIATLCGAYVLARALDRAAQACDDAVTALPGDTSYNNRGVLRVFTGDFNGAARDFERAGPGNRDEYLAELIANDVRLTANDNSILLQNLSARFSSSDVLASVAMSGAKVEHVED